MLASDDRRPVLVGVAQLVQRDIDPAHALSPLSMLERSARDAALDACVGEAALRALDTLAIVDVVGWHPRNGPRLLAQRLGAAPRREVVSAIGGEIPVRIVNELARSIATGRSRIALVAGSNHVRTLRRAQHARAKLDWDTGGEGAPERIGESRPGSSKGEAAYGLSMPIHIYPVFENALRARRGLALDAHRRRIGALMSRFSEVAAKNPFAWFPVARSADEIATPDARNRMIAYPYTKFMNAVIETDQGAAALMMSAAAARELGVPEDRWVHWWGGAHADEAVWFPSERPDFARCEALRDSALAALSEAETPLERIDAFDFYSCFPVAVEMACEMLGLDEDDPRGFTLTGGLPYAGGPGNNYTLHAIAAMVEKLREAPGSRGLVTGNGWYLTKHAALVLSSAPREGDVVGHAAPVPEPSLPDDTASTGPAEGRAALETYTVVFDREGAPIRGIAIGRTDAGRRFVARTPDDRAFLEAFVAVENVGRPGRVRAEDGQNLFEPD
jgi:acetyl-CoA C-acetyltransferase